MKRCVYRAQCIKGCEEKTIEWVSQYYQNIRTLVEEESLMTLSIFKYKRHFFLYYECTGEEILPDELFKQPEKVLLPWQGEEYERFWVPMMDVYHCAEPVSRDFWKRRGHIKCGNAKIVRLKPEMVSSYIYYHYQYQEEKPGDFAKYAAIYLYENIILMYTEQDDEPSVTPYKGKLDSNTTPENWHELMLKHFAPFDEKAVPVYNSWMNIETVVNIFWGES